MLAFAKAEAERLCAPAGRVVVSIDGMARAAPARAECPSSFRRVILEPEFLTNMASFLSYESALAAGLIL